jgi:hypothetical protein
VEPALARLGQQERGDRQQREEGEEVTSRRDEAEPDRRRREWPIVPMPTQTIVLAINSGLGRLRNGLPAVQVTYTTIGCVASYSTNHPVRKSASDA